MGGNLVDYAAMSDKEIHCKLVWFWFRFFRLNENFKKYCEARRNVDDVTRRRLEKEFQKIEELYNDWGDIHILPDMYHDDLIEWKAWLNNKRSLFFVHDIEIVDTCDESPEGGKISISIPTGLNKIQLCRLFEEFVVKNPGILGSGPKYSLTSIKGQRQSETLNRLEKAELVHDLVSGYGEFEFSYAEIAELILKVPSLREFGFKWYPTADQKVRMENKAFRKSEVSDYKRTLVNLKRFFENTVEGTIQGRFPASL
jgi:hypothetical protein